MINNFENIFKSPKLKTELMFIFGCLIDAIIADELDVLLEFILMRKISIKHFNCEIDFKKNFDFYTKELLNYLLKFMKGSNDSNKKMIIKYYINSDFYLEIYTKLSYVYYYGVSGILDRNYDEAINLGIYLLKNKDILYDERFIYTLIYMAKCKKRKSNQIKTKKGAIRKIYKKEEENFLKLEKKLIDMHYEVCNEEEIQSFPPSIFYKLSKFYRPSSTNHDAILEYVLLNRASNSPLLKLKKYSYDNFQEKYLIYKTKKLLKKIEKDEKFQKLYNAKGIINIEGYGEDGTICPICFDKKKEIICLPCKHFFCEACINKLILKGTCPICRAHIRITFNIYTKEEKIIKKVESDSSSSEEDESNEEDIFSFESENDVEDSIDSNNNDNNEVINFTNLSLG